MRIFDFDDQGYSAPLAYKNDKKPRDAAGTFLFITNNFPQDSMAFKAIGFAATTYDSIPDRSRPPRRMKSPIRSSRR